jgi:hypothetical protein
MDVWRLAAISCRVNGGLAGGYEELPGGSLRYLSLRRTNYESANRAMLKLWLCAEAGFYSYNAIDACRSIFFTTSSVSVCLYHWCCSRFRSSLTPS